MTDPKKATPPIGPGLARIICLMFTVLILVGIEGAARLWFVEEHLDEILAFLDQDSELWWRQKTNARVRFQDVEVCTDRLGFRNVTLTASKPEGVFRIVCLGASPTFGWGVEQHENYPSRLQELLSGRFGNRVEVVSAAVVGYSSHQGLKLLKQKILDLKPDLITASYVLNDLDKYRFFRSDGRPDRELETHHPFLVETKNILYKSMFVRWMEKSFSRVSAGSVGFDKYRTNIYYPGKRRVPPEDYERNIAGIVKLARESGVTPVLIVFPVNLPFPDPVSEKDRQKARDLLVSVLESSRNSKPGQANQSAEERIRTMLEEAVQLDPYYSEAYYYLGVWYRERGDFPAASDHFKKAKDQEAYRCGRDGRLYNAVMRNIATEMDVAAVDIVPAFEAVKDGYLFVDPNADPIHPNARGHDIIARELYGCLEKNGLLPTVVQSQ